MKKIYVLAAAAIMAASSATSVMAQVKHGIRAGLNIDNQGLGTSNGDSESGISKIGFHLGYQADIPLGNYFAFQPTALFTTRGCANEVLGVKTKETLYYIEVAPMFSLRVSFADGWFKWNILQFGPSFGIRLFGEGTADGKKMDIEFFSPDSYRRFDWGLSFGDAFEFGNFYIGGRYYMGLFNLIDNENVAIVNGSMMLTLGWNF
jgi:hypothetical protein